MIFPAAWSLFSGRGSPSPDLLHERVQKQVSLFCPFCNSKPFAKPSDQKRHVLEQHEGRKQVCRTCHQTMKRSYNHGTCRGRKSTFQPVKRESAIGRGCGLCLAYFGDFDKWIRHLQIHQKYDGKQKEDWDISLELQGRLRGPDLNEYLTRLPAPSTATTRSTECCATTKQVLRMGRFVCTPKQLQDATELPLQNTAEYACLAPQGLASSVEDTDPEDVATAQNRMPANGTDLDWWQWTSEFEDCSSPSSPQEMPRFEYCPSD